MMPGQQVVLADGSLGQLSRMIATSVNGPAGTQPVPATNYEVYVEATNMMVYVTVPNRRPWWWSLDRWAQALASAPKPTEGQPA